MNTMTDRRRATTLENSEFLPRGGLAPVAGTGRGAGRRGPPGSTPAFGRAEFTLSIELRTLERQVIKCVADDEFLVQLMRPYLPGLPAGVPSDLAEYLPIGVAAEALRQAREQEDHPPTRCRTSTPLRRSSPGGRGGGRRPGDWAGKALRGGCRRTTRCPSARGDGPRFTAETARLEGNPAAMRTSFDQVLRTAPCLFRSLGLAVPVTIQGDGSDLADRTARRVLASSRFRRNTPRGFLLKLRTENGRLVFALYQLNDTQQCVWGRSDRR